jgi:PAS domain-containing protein
LPAKDFERLLLDSIDEALSSTEEKLEKETYAQLESRDIPRLEIPRNIRTFTRVIEEVFGTAADDLKLLILKKLHEKNGWPFVKMDFDDMTFTDQVERVCGRIYSEIINQMQTPVAVVHIEDISYPSPLRLIAINPSAAKATGINAEETLGKTIHEAYPEIHASDFEKNMLEVIRSGRAKNLGKFQRSDGHVLKGAISITAFPFSGNSAGLVFKPAAEHQLIDLDTKGDEKLSEDDESNVGEWRWELDTLGRQVSADKSRVRERLIRKEITHEPHRADYFSIRGKEYLENGDLPRAREFFRQAEEMYQRSNETEDAFENASLRIRTYLFEETIPLEEYFQAAEQYLDKYADFFMDRNFVENLANYCQWKGYKHEKEHKFADARGSYAEAEEMFLTLKQRNKALFNGSRRALTYMRENIMEMYERSAEALFDRYSEFSGNKYYKEVRAHYYSHKADNSADPLKTMEFRSEAEKLFLEINQKELAFKNACKLLDLYWENIPSKDEQVIQKCLNATERFFEKYQNFSEHEYYRKRMAEYYLLQARALASQLKEVLR